VILAALLAGVISTHDPRRLNPAERLKAPSAANFLGTDEFGPRRVQPGPARAPRCRCSSGHDDDPDLALGHRIGLIAGTTAASTWR